MEKKYFTVDERIKYYTEMIAKAEARLRALNAQKLDELNKALQKEVIGVNEKNQPLKPHGGSPSFAERLKQIEDALSKIKTS